MSDMIWLTDEQMACISPYFPRSHGVPRVDDKKVISGILFVIRNGLRWRDVPKDYGPHKTIYNRFIRWSKLGVFNKIFASLAAKSEKLDHIMIDATHLKAHRTAASLLKKGAFPDVSGAQKGGLTSKLHAVCDEKGRPVIMLVTEGQVSDYSGAALICDVLPKAKTLLADRGYDADWFRKALIEKDIILCIPPRKNRKLQMDYDKVLYKKRHKVENMFAKLKDWRRIHTRYDRCAHTFFSAICIAATVLFWINQ